MLGEIKFSKFIDRTPGFLTRKENIHFGRQIIVSASVGLTLLLQFSREGLQICPTSIHLEGVQYGSLMQYSRQRRKMLPSGAIFIALFIEPHFQLFLGDRSTASIYSFNTSTVLPSDTQTPFTSLAQRHSSCFACQLLE